MISQRKAFYRQRILESSGATKETVDIDILAKSRNGDRKIKQFIRIMMKEDSFRHILKMNNQFLNIYVLHNIFAFYQTLIAKSN